MNYDASFFIAKFSVIPDESWITGSQANTSGQHCAIGFCASRKFYDPKESDGASTPEGLALNRLFKNYLGILAPPINNGYRSCSVFMPFLSVTEMEIVNRYQQPTPKARILAALHDIRDLQLKEKGEQPAPATTEPIFLNQPISINLNPVMGFNPNKKPVSFEQMKEKQELLLNN